MAQREQPSHEPDSCADDFRMSLFGRPAVQNAEALDVWLQSASPDDIARLVEIAGQLREEPDRQILESVAEHPDVPEHLGMTARGILASAKLASAGIDEVHKAVLAARGQTDQLRALSELLRRGDRASVVLLRTVRPRSRFCRRVICCAIRALEEGIEGTLAEFRSHPGSASAQAFVLIASLREPALQEFLVSDLLLSGRDGLVEQAIMVLVDHPAQRRTLGDQGVQVLLSVISRERRLRVGWIGGLTMALTREWAVEILRGALTEGDPRTESRLREIAARLDRKNDDDARVRRKIQRVLADVRRQRKTAQMPSESAVD